MLVLISYDVNTMDKAGRARLRKVAKECQNHGQRVQNSVFEANLNYSQWLRMKNNLLKLIDLDKDSLRFYYLGNNWHGKVEQFGTNISYDSEGLLLVE